MTAQRAAGGALLKFTRIGFACKGVVYLMIGLLALKAAFQQGGETTGKEGAITRIAQQPFGEFALIVVGVGLLAYAAWRLLCGAMDLEHEGDRPTGLAKRIGYVLSGAVYGSAGIFAFKLLTGNGGGQGGDGAATWTARLMEAPGGTLLVALAGIGYYREEACASCHVGEQSLGPNLATKSKRTVEWMVNHFKNPRPGANMPAVQLTGSQMTALARFLLKLDAENASALEAAPQNAVEGAMIYEAQHCNVCHQVNGAGMKTGPSLNGVAQRRTRDWLEQHFVDPQKISPGTTMPAYKFSSRDMDRMITYLQSIP